MAERETQRPSRTEFKESIRQDFEEFRSGQVSHSLRRDLEEISQFYLDDPARDKMTSMGQVKKSVYVSFEVLKSMFFKLTPARRLMLILAIFLAFNGLGSSTGQVLGAFVIMLFILILELKDKLLAQDELLAGRAVQRALMPATSPAVGGWDTWIYTRPANDVGGDLVDYLELADGRTAISIGDVAGKGLGAALMMAKLQATVRAVATDYSSLADLGLRVNSIIRRDGLPSKFASLVYLMLERDSNVVRLLNAGHLPPVVYRSSGATELSHNSPAIGIMEDPTFEEQQVALEPGEFLIVFSDGVTEARDEYGSFFGSTRLQKLLPVLRNLPAHQVGERIVRRVEDFVGEARWTDDLSIAVIRRVG
ncbi:MAG: PP2C family protein-serine/threonine phosphatase [Rhodothermales bacterium]|nr:PP2C family protein-serine/threonine phosphatase [Rhodothermales bacterium]